MKKKKYDISLKNFYDLENNLTLPPFQRALVWTEKQKKELIETLSNGFPFGSILISRGNENNLNSPDNFILIDGLQRYTTIKDYEKHPHKYYAYENSVEEVMKIIDPYILDTKIRPTLKDEIEAIIKEFVKLDSIEKSKALYLRDAVSDCLRNYSITIGDQVKDALTEQQLKISDDYKKYLNLKDLEIPCIVFNGENSELADVFENLNRGGVKLSKYQIFASTWHDKEIFLDSGDISESLLTISVERYDNLSEQRNIKIEGYDRESFLNNRKINLFEMCYAIGKIVCDKLNAFYKPSEITDDLINSIGFSTIAIILNVSNKKMSEISNHMNILSDTKRIEFAIREISKIYKEINNFYNDVFQYPGKKNDFKVEMKNFQLLSIFACCWIESVEPIYKKDSKLEMKKSAKRRRSEILKNSLPYFISDYIHNYWGSAGDSKLDNCYYTKSPILVNRYLKPIMRRNLQDNLISYYEDKMNYASLNFSKFTRYLIVLAYNNLSYDSTETYEFEHIIPKRFIKNHNDNKDNSQKISGGLIGNACLIAKKMNNGKKDLTIYEYYNEKKLNYEDIIEYLHSIDYIEKNIWDDINSTINIEEKADKINEFIRKRNITVAEKVMDKIFRFN